MKAFKVFIDFKQPLDKNKAHGILYEADNSIGVIVSDNKTEACNQIHEKVKCLSLPSGIDYQLRLEEMNVPEIEPL